MTFRHILLAVGATLSLAAQATSVVSYDVTNANESWFGGWGNHYFGTITPLGNGLVNYSGGSGSLNDGVVPADVYTDNQLFWMANAPTITLHLDGPTKVTSVQIYGGDVGASNHIPGTVTGWTVTIGGQSVALGSLGFGNTCDVGPCNDHVSLVGTGLELLDTDTVTLSHFQGGWNGYFNAAEVTVNSMSNVPEPESLALMLAGLAMVGGLIQQRRRAR